MKTTLFFIAALLVLQSVVFPSSAQATPDTITAVQNFTTKLVELLNILIGKAGLFQALPIIGEPITAVLRQLESSTDSLMFTIIDKPCLVQGGIADINAITAELQALKAPANTINIVNGPLIVVGLGPFPQIITGLNKVITDENAANQRIKGSTRTCSADDGTIVRLATQSDIVIQNAINAYNGLIGV